MKQFHELFQFLLIVRHGWQHPPILTGDTLCIFSARRCWIHVVAINKITEIDHRISWLVLQIYNYILFLVISTCALNGSITW